LPEEQYTISVKITMPVEMRVRMSQLGISPRAIALRAFREEIRFKEEQAKLKELKTKDPRSTLADLRRRTSRTRRLLDE
jgi:hypothetical protein